MADVCPRCERPLRDDGKCPSCDERKSDRMGDATLGRIADLAGGWTLEAVATTPDELAKFISSEIAKWRDIITTAGITVAQ